MPSKYQFLLIGYRPEEQWPAFLQTAVNSLGKLHTAQSEDEATKMLSLHKYNLVIVDAGGVDDAALLVSRLRKQQVRPPILVVTASPTWQSARAVLKAGAVDYVGRSFDKDELRSRIEAIVGPVPSKPNSSEMK